MAKNRDLVRFTFYERLVHWLIGLSLSYLLLTGMAFAYPKLFWLLNLVGGAPTARWCHPWVGVIFTIALVMMYFAWVKDMAITAEDRRWFGALSHYAKHEKDKVPPTGKYNGGQKMFFWAMVLFGVLHVVSGVPLWFPQTFGLGLIPAMRFIHFFVTLPALLLVLMHVYLGLLLFPGTARGMIYGTVTRAWARMHHPIWAREKAAGD